MPNAGNLIIGIDWGTHSSKWWYSVNSTNKPTQPTRIPAVIDSTIYRYDNALTIYREKARRTREDIADPRLKRLLLGDPQGASYWDAVREGIGISLGEASVLTIACMVGDLLKHLETEGFDINEETKIAIRFSLPNWIGDDARHKAARRRMYETTVVCAGLINHSQLKELPNVGSRIDINHWRNLIKAVRQDKAVAELIAETPNNFAEMVEGEYRVGFVSWRLAAESSAAGYLPLEDLLWNVPKNANSQRHWVKLLVVDVGAGSTDTGYFVSSRTVKGRELMMNYLPPARTLDFAGEALTELLCDYYIREHRRELSVEEAEIMKVSAPEKWSGQAFVKDWRDKIAKSVADYIFHVPDELRLGEPAIPGLKVVLTGGSGIVLGLDSAIKEAVVDALARRGVPGNVAARTELVPFKARVIEDRVDALRRAVSVGEGNPNFAMLSYREHFKKTEARVVAAKGWV